MYRLSTIYSRYKSKGGACDRDRHDFLSCKSRYFSITNLIDRPPPFPGFQFHSISIFSPFSKNERRRGDGKRKEIPVLRKGENDIRRFPLFITNNYHHPSFSRIEVELDNALYIRFRQFPLTVKISNF